MLNTRIIGNAFINMNGVTSLIVSLIGLHRIKNGVESENFVIASVLFLFAMLLSIVLREVAMWCRFTRLKKL